MFTDGKDTPGWGTVNTTFEELEARSRREEVMVYAIGLADRCDNSAQSSGTPASGSRAQRGRPRPPGGVGRPGGLPGGLPPVQFPRPGRGGLPPPTTPPPFVLPPRHPDRGCGDTQPDPDLRRLADAGGGGYFELHDTDNLAATFARVANELHHQYALGFTPAALDGKMHELTVHLSKPDLVARARKRYLASKAR
jgi:VWFA-related protein